MPHRSAVLLVLVAIVATALRLVNLGESPPGLHVDAAANAWNSYCLLHTGRDWTGDPWPILFSRAFGENVPALYYYALIPFQAAWGMSARTTPLPSALGGVASVLLVFVIGRRLYGWRVGLLAAAVLAVTPWHLFLSRWGHEAGLVPLLTTLPVAALQWAGLPFGDRPAGGPKPVRAVLAGALFGVACYGYFAVRLFLPALLVGIACVQARDWAACARSRRGRVAVACLALGLCATLGPLVYGHATDPAMAKRGGQMKVWDEADPLTVKIAKAAARYPGHFGPSFLFGRGDTLPTHRLPESGPLGWYLLPLLVAGALAVLHELRSSASARILAVWLVLYPVPDLVLTHPSPHLLRSAPGLPALILAASVGAARGVAWIRAWRPRVARVAAAMLLLAALVGTGRFLHAFFGSYTRDRDIRRHFNADLLDASGWVRPRLDEVDAVFFSCRDSAALSQPFVITLVGFRYDPARWFRDEVLIERRPDTNLYRRYGKVHFLFDDTDLGALRRLETNGRADRVVVVLRPGEWAGHGRTPVHEIRHPDGTPAFTIYDERL
jgi:4-amino-4-deoxy-L-arabinose transferase-like glycosyltransferase